MDFSYVLTQDSQDADADLKSLIGPDRNQIKKPVPPIWSEVFPNLLQERKGYILLFFPAFSNNCMKTLSSADNAVFHKSS